MSTGIIDLVPIQVFTEIRFAPFPGFLEKRPTIVDKLLDLFPHYDLSRPDSVNLLRDAGGFPVTFSIMPGRLIIDSARLPVGSFTQLMTEAISRVAEELRTTIHRVGIRAILGFPVSTLAEAYSLLTRAFHLRDPGFSGPEGPIEITEVKFNYSGATFQVHVALSGAAMQAVVVTPAGVQTPVSGTFLQIDYDYYVEGQNLTWSSCIAMASGAAGTIDGEAKRLLEFLVGASK